MMQSHRFALALAGAWTLVFAAAGSAATIIPIESFDPATFFSGGITAGLDFNDGGPTEAGFAGIPASNNKAYNVTTNGITFNVVVSNANLANQNRDRNDNPPDHKGDLMRDFEQWYGNTGLAVETAFTLSGLVTRTDYDISFFTYNAGAGQTTHNFYEGTSSADPFIMTFTTSGNWYTYSTWRPGITFRINSGSAGEISVTAQGTVNATDLKSRLTMDGVSVIQGDTLPPDGTVFILK